ncbi:hypothetical protein Rs2_01892 [Raphanus sativus]|uniref:Uncharacterized protein LOC108860895 n=1 Tax=Raphanus sativus TaxID=3726 RepID=A0A6J0P015_RAPSA|nr:uncharacterized protein LOC108860895 [Raphanus sativus]KAJ4916342.1 hypothetical protein Rs2_01892 [Raphanus sativus]
MKINKSTLVLSFFLISSLFCLSALAENSKPSDGSTILFTTMGSSTFEFDIFTLPTSKRPPSPSDEHRLTDGKSINFNGHLASPSPALISLLPNSSGIKPEDKSLLHLLYVTERDGAPTLHYDLVHSDKKEANVQVELLSDQQTGMNVNTMKDTPFLTDEHLVYVSTQEKPVKAQASWAAVYSTELRTKKTQRLTPSGIADFSPAVSPSGKWTAVASYGEKGWSIVSKELSTDIYVFLTSDGSQRVMVVEQGGWPRWTDESTLYFHRKSDDGWISVYRAVLPKTGPISTKTVTVERVTPSGLHAFTPATSPNNNDFIAVATRRPGSELRHVELFDLKKNELVEMTRLVSPKSHHFNPFLSPDSSRVGYHSCRGDRTGRTNPHNLLQKLKTTSEDLSLFRFEGAFPSVSPDNERFAFVTFTGVFVVNQDGSDLRQILPQVGFGTVWDPVRHGIVYTSSDPSLNFSTPGSVATHKINILAIDVDVYKRNPSGAVKKLTTGGQNNAFPWPSPDGKRIVFRSDRSGTKNLYIMDAEKGEAGGLFRLTDGNWNDTIATWSPDNNWIVFASNREYVGTLLMDLYVVHPDGTGLRKVAQNLSGGVSMHPMFSPDSKRIVFTTTYAGISAEPIGNPKFNVASSEIFTVNLDGTDFMRLTHNSVEDGPPLWFPKIKATGDVAWPKRFGPSCDFEDFKLQNTTVKMNKRSLMCPSQ